MSSLASKKRRYLAAQEAYYNSSGNPLMSDAEFDALEDAIRAEDPSWEGLARTGVHPGRKTDTELPHAMPSLNKIYLEEEARLARWANGRRLLATPKLDGSSVLEEYKYGVLTRVITRGDGITGGDVSHLIPYLSSPKRIPAFKTYASVLVRCEAILSRADFSAHFDRDEFVDARAAANGMLNRIKPHANLKYLDLVALRVLEVDGAPIALGAGLALLRTTMHPVVRSVALDGRDAVTASRRLMGTWVRADFPYAADGIVLAEDTAATFTDKKPAHAVAVKCNTSTETLRTTVLAVEWQRSRYNAFTPKAKLAAVTFSNGTRVEYATLHNARWVVDNGVGPGSVVDIVRSGEVIPKVVAVIKRRKPTMPDAAHEWRGPDVYAVAESNGSHNEDALRRQVAYAVATLGFEHVGPEFAATVARKVATAGQPFTMRGFTRTLLTQPDRVFAFGGLSPKMVAKVVASQKKPPTLASALRASHMFSEGLGERRSEILADCIVSGATSREALQAALGNVFGARFHECLSSDEWPRFASYPEVAALIKAPHTPRRPAATGSSLAGVRVAFTGYRNEEHEEWITTRGGSVAAFSGKTTHLLVKPDGKASSKVAKARDSGVAVLTFQELKEKFA